MVRRCFHTLFLTIICLVVAKAQDSSFAKVHVKAFENLSRSKGSNDQLFRRDYLKLTVDSLFVLRKNVKPNKNIILYIDNIPFNDLEPEFENDSTAIFYFQKNANSTEPDSKAWAFFYKKPRRWELKNKNISLGYKGGEAVKSDANVDIVIIQSTWYFTGIGLIGVLAFILVRLSLNSGLLRDSGSLPSKQRPYSLARTQFVFWLLLISSAYIFLWISTGEMPVLTNSSLILLGISGGTSIVAKLIDNNQSLFVSPNRRNDSFLIDILSDENGISIYRVQMLVFTVVIGFIFCHDVIVVFEMPDFDSTLLTLMGISSGTYAGFKVTENSPATPVG